MDRSTLTKLVELANTLIKGSLLDEFGNRDDNDLHTLISRSEDEYVNAQLRIFYKQAVDALLGTTEKTPE